MPSNAKRNEVKFRVTQLKYAHALVKVIFEEVVKVEVCRILPNPRALSQPQVTQYYMVFPFNVIPGYYLVFHFHVRKVEGHHQMQPQCLLCIHPHISQLSKV